MRSLARWSNGLAYNAEDQVTSNFWSRIKKYGLSASIALFFGFSVASVSADPLAYVTIQNGNVVSVIDTATNAVLANIGVGVSPRRLVVTPDGTLVYVANTNSHNVSVISTATNVAVAHIAVGSFPRGIAVTPDGARVYVANNGSQSVSVINTATNTVVATIAAGFGPLDLAVTPNGARVYLSQGSQSVAIIDTATNTVVATIPVGFAPQAVAMTPDGASLYLANFQSSHTGLGEVSRFDTATNTVVETVAVGNIGPVDLALTPDGAHLYVAGQLSNIVSVIDTATNTIAASVTVGSSPRGVTVTPDGTLAYVANTNSNSVSVITTSTNTVVDTVTVSGAPADVAILGSRVLELTAAKDSFLRDGNPDRNEGSNPGLRIASSGKNRAIVGFDDDAINNYINDFGLTKATLVLNIAENADNWGKNDDRTVDAHPLLEDFDEGNGQNAGVPASDATRGDGSGVTWNCAVDEEISNQATDCDPKWNGGNFGPATADSQLHVNGQLGEVSWDVTDDVLAGAFGWLIKKTAEGQAGKVFYYSKEGADEVGEPSLAPRLILE